MRSTREQNILVSSKINRWRAKAEKRVLKSFKFFLKLLISLKINIKNSKFFYSKCGPSKFDIKKKIFFEKKIEKPNE